MSKHFQWILTCVDDGDTYTLINDPIGFEDCVYKMERHATYKGIFNQFTSNLKLHYDGGGKAFIDEKYQVFDINGQITIEVKIDTDGNGLVYETLFTGKLNLASYQDDGTHTIVNIEQSDLATKLNTRAGIPVPINVPVIEVPGQPSFKVAIIDTYLPADNSDVTTGTYIFNDPAIVKNKIYKVVTVDETNTEVGDSVTFTADHQTGPGGTSGSTTIQITDIEDGAIEVTFANINGDIYLYQVGTQLSLGQQSIAPVTTRQINLTGIPILYESDFKMSGDVQSAESVDIDDAGIVAGHTYTVYAVAADGTQVSSTVVYTGITLEGFTGINKDTSIKITGIVAGTITVDVQNAYDTHLDLWKDGDFLTTQIISLPVAGQVFAATMPPDNTSAGGLLTFNADTVFDNLNAFIFGKNEITAGLPSDGSPGDPLYPDAEELTPIFDGFNEPFIQYPVTMQYRIKLTATIEDTATHPDDIATRTNNFFLKMAVGQDLASAAKYELAHLVYSNNDGSSFDVEITEADFPITLNRGDKIWFYAKYRMIYSDVGEEIDFSLKVKFTVGILDFKLAQYALPTTATGVMIHEAFNQVADMIGDSDGNFYSEFYGRTDSEKRAYDEDGEGSKRLISNGLCVRGRLDKYISTSLNDLFSSMAAIDNIGMEIDGNNRLRVEKLEHFFDKDTKTATLDRVYSYQTLNENSLYYNQIEVGYDKWETEIYFKNGLDEVHGKRYYGTRVATAKGTVLQKYGSEVKGSISNKLERICKLIAGNYAIELTRRKNIGWANDDFKYDNDNFIFCLGTDLQPEQAQSILEETGGEIIKNVFRPDLATGWLNMGITPARMLQSNMNLITAGLQKIKGNIQFLNGEGNYLAATKFKDDGAERQNDYNFYQLGENTSISYGDGNVRNITPLWVPEIYRFEYPLTYTQFKAIRSNPNGYIQFWKFENRKKKGFILSMEYNLKTGLTKFELLKVYDPDIMLAESEDARVLAGEDSVLMQTIEQKR